MDVEALAKQYMSFYRLSYDVEKKEGHYDILMPYLMMDAGYHFVKRVEGYRKKGMVVHKAAQYLTRWHNAYTQYFNTLFIAYPEKSESRADIIDLMDKLEDFISHDIEIMEFCGGSCFMEYGKEKEDMLTSALMANFFSLNSYASQKFLLQGARLSKYSWSKFQNILRSSGAVLQNSKNFSQEIMSDRGASEVAGRRLEELVRSQKAINNKLRLWVRTEIAGGETC